ncbi:MAG: zf-HC2 domain-containing protein [Planctomycetes bacterium]|nr:zf-HC2 domain-containing protein [Planctomycetota bacterium]
MDCLRTRELLSPFIDGELALDLARGVLAHMQTCAACRAEAGAMRAASGMVRSVAGPAPAGLRTRILSQASEARAPSRLSGTLRLAAPRAALVLLGAAAVVFVVPLLAVCDGADARSRSSYQLLVNESEAEAGLLGSRHHDFLALARSPEARLMVDVVGGRR